MVAGIVPRGLRMVLLARGASIGNIMRVQSSVSLDLPNTVPFLTLGCDFGLRVALVTRLTLTGPFFGPLLESLLPCGVGTAGLPGVVVVLLLGMFSLPCMLPWEPP